MRKYVVEFTYAAGAQRLALEDSARQELNQFLDTEVAADPFQHGTQYTDSETMRVGRTNQVTFFFVPVEAAFGPIRQVVVMAVKPNGRVEEQE